MSQQCRVEPSPAPSTGFGCRSHAGFSTSTTTIVSAHGPFKLSQRPSDSEAASLNYSLFIRSSMIFTSLRRNYRLVILHNSQSPATMHSVVSYVHDRSKGRDHAWKAETMTRFNTVNSFHAEAIPYIRTYESAFWGLGPFYISELKREKKTDKKLREYQKGEKKEHKKEAKRATVNNPNDSREISLGSSVGVIFIPSGISGISHRTWVRCQLITTGDPRRFSSDHRVEATAVHPTLKNISIRIVSSIWGDSEQESRKPQLPQPVSRDASLTNHPSVRVLHVSINIGLARTRASNTFIIGPLFVHFLRFAVAHRMLVVRFPAKFVFQINLNCIREESGAAESCARSSRRFGCARTRGSFSAAPRRVLAFARSRARVGQRATASSAPHAHRDSARPRFGASDLTPACAARGVLRPVNACTMLGGLRRMQMRGTVCGPLRSALSPLRRWTRGVCACDTVALMRGTAAIRASSSGRGAGCVLPGEGKQGEKGVPCEGGNLWVLRMRK
ncbi:hypothetical protein DFH09DRAFT_1270929 [Mycena vulgaris]|nr:hypothetical protein DFH09DRAFT_1270929 [Mycena vulgaris]